jgi:hypothetical protein
MKRIILLSTFVLTQTIFATTLTIYNSNLALIDESIDFTIEQNTTQFSYDAIPKTIIDDSVSLAVPKGVEIQEQHFKSRALLPASLAKKSTLKPTLSFDLTTTQAYKTKVHLNYLMHGISFKNDYRIDLQKEKANLTAWVDITNNSGKDFKDVSINLLAGDTAHNRYPTEPIMLRSNISMAPGKKIIQHHAIAGYHKYNLTKKTDLKSYEKSRIKLFSLNNLPYKNSYIAQMNNPLYLMGERTSSVTREIHFNTIPREMPQGTIRIYTNDSNELLFLGDQHIQNQPKAMPLTLHVGKDFDTKVRQELIQRDDTKTAFNVTVKYTLINHSQNDKILTLRIPFNKKIGSKVTSTLHYSYTKGNYVTFQVKVKANSQRSFEANFTSKRR